MKRTNIYRGNLLRRAFFLLLFLLFIFTVRVSANSLYVGQSTIFVAPSAPSSNAAVYNTAWSCSNPNVSIHSSTYSATVTVNSYFSGDATIYCDYYYYWYVGSFMHTAHQTTSYTVSCIPVSIRLNESNTLELAPGETSQLTCKLSPNISPTPYITWKSSNTRIATVNSGCVKAISPGTATITVSSNAGDGTATCFVTVDHVNPQSISISPATASVYIGETTTLNATVLPENTLQSVRWSSDNTDVATVNSNGVVTGQKAGTANIIATSFVNSNIYSQRLVTVTEPPFIITSYIPKSNSTENSVFTKPSVTFSIALFAGINYSSIGLKNANTGDLVKGVSSINGLNYTFTPDEPLEPQTNYTLDIPASAFKNEWGSDYTSPIISDFKTGELQKLTLNVSSTSGFYSVGDSIMLKASDSIAKIYYTVDGSTPTENSLLYTKSIIINQDMKLRAVAIGKGYVSSDVLSADYYISSVNMLKKFPTVNDTLYICKDVIPYVTFGNAIGSGDNIDKVTLSIDDTVIPSEIIVADSSIFIIPKEPLIIGSSYKVVVPDSAVISWQGEPNKVVTWTFSTGNFVNYVSLNGFSQGAAIKSDGSLWNWGMQIDNADATVGSYSCTMLDKPKQICSNDVDTVSTGYMHNAMLKKDGSLWMWGRQYCGEFGNNSNTAATVPVKVMSDISYVSAGGQTTAVIKNDGSLWMCGRNDFGQLGDSSVVTRMSMMKIMDDVKSVAAGWCSTYAIKNDGTLWAWGRNDFGQLGVDSIKKSLIPIKIMDDVSSVVTSPMDCYNVAVLKNDGSLWTWGRNDFGQLGNGKTISTSAPQKIMDDITKVSVGSDFMQAIDTKGYLWAWGNNVYGQLGTETVTVSSVPVKVENDMVSVSTGMQATCALKDNGSVWTWGRNYKDILGHGNTKALSSPVLIIDGMSISDLSGLSLRKSKMEVAINGKNVVIAYPYHLNSDYTNLTWQSSDNSIAQVSDRGVVTGMAEGIAEIKVTINGTNGLLFQKVCTVKVSEVTSVENVAASPLHIWDSNSTVFINGINKNTQISVYNTIGKIIYKTITSDTSLEIPLIEKGIYIVKAGNVIKKVINR